MSNAERNHYTRTPADWVAGCSDVGLRHTSNQDALCIAIRENDGDRTALIAVADGVSTAAGSEIASSVAVERTINVLQDRLAGGIAENVAFVQAFAEANRHVLAAKVEGEPSACTLVTAHVRRASISIANVGDSRAYWVGDDGTYTLLSTDDSMAQARMMLGMSRDDAEQGDHAHAITKWLGKDSANVMPSVTVHQPTVAGWLVLCTDGLWNYASAPEAMGAVVTEFLQQYESLGDVVEALVAWANDAGGKDNITVTMTRVEV